MNKEEKIKGVNLGGWLVLERWITPSLFAENDHQDEFSFSKHLGTNAQQVLNKHRQTFITENDFRWIAQAGLNAVRLPIGHWALDTSKPYISCAEYIDFTFKEAKKNNLGVLLDIHGAQGSQNGWDHSGKVGNIGWTEASNIESTLAFIDKLAAKYKDHTNLIGIEVLNEPHWSVPHEALVTFYKESYKIIRNWLGEEALVVISDAFRPKDWQKTMPAKHFKNLLIDLHLYQVFSEEDRLLSPEGHLKKASKDWSKLINDLQKHHPVIIGEWSLALPEQSVSNEFLKKYSESQFEGFEKAEGWFFWTYKTEAKNSWNFRYLVEQGIIKL